MNKLTPRLCLSCKCSFIPRPQHPNQKFCSESKCQKDRKNRTNKSKIKTDPAYSENQANANKRWREKNPDYQRNYRTNRKKGCENIDSLKNILSVNLYDFSGIYQLTIIESNENMTVLTIKLDLISNS